MAKSINGGWHWPAKMFCYKKPIELPENPDYLSIPLWHGGKASVFTGDWVHAYDIIGYDHIGLPIYAPLAGQVEKIEEFPDLVARPKNWDYPRLTIWIKVSEAQHMPSHILEPWPRFWEKTRAELGGRIWEAGIQDLQDPRDIELLIFNGLNLEPPLSGNIRLLREVPEQLIEGMRVLMQTHRSVRGRIILSPDMSDIIEQMKVLLTSAVNISVSLVAPKYPQGHEKLLKDCFPEAKSSKVYSIEEVWDIRQAVAKGMPKISKLCTIWDQTSGQSANIRLPLGMNMEQIFKRDLSRYRNIKLIMGGLMTGRSYYSSHVPVISGVDGVIMMKDDVSWESNLCSNCGECGNICPEGLSPNCIYAAVDKGEVNKIISLNIAKCLECGLCSFVCPSRMHLLHQIKTGKLMIAARKGSSTISASIRSVRQESQLLDEIHAPEMKMDLA
jgi:electron transport complex protein RnfC